MEEERQKEIIDKALSYASEDPYNGEDGYQQSLPSLEDGEEAEDLAYRVSILRQLNS